MKISSQSPFVHCIYMCAHIFLVDQFIPLIGFSLFVQYSLLGIYTLTTPNVMTLQVTILVMHVCMASYIMVGYEHANHAFRVNVHSQVTVRSQVMVCYKVFQGYGFFRVLIQLTVVLKAKFFPSLVSFSRILLLKRIFSIVRLDFQMLMAAITYPLFTYIMFSFLLFNLNT